MERQVRWRKWHHQLSPSLDDIQVCSSVLTTQVCSECSQRYCVSDLEMLFLSQMLLLIDLGYEDVQEDITTFQELRGVVKGAGKNTQVIQRVFYRKRLKEI